MGLANVFTIVIFFLMGATVIISMMLVQKAQLETALGITEQQEEMKLELQSEIEIINGFFNTTRLVYWEDTSFDDFEAGNYTEVDIFSYPGSVTMKYSDPNYLEGDYISQFYDTGYISNFTTIQWNDTLEAGTSIRFQIRTGDNVSDTKAQVFTGPAGNPGSYYLTSSGELLNDVITDNKRVIQYKAEFSNVINTNKATLNWVKIGVERGIPHHVLVVENIGNTQIDSETIDIYIDNERILRNDSLRDIYIDEIEKPGYFSPDEIMNITIFKQLPDEEHLFTVLGEKDVEDSTIYTPSAGGPAPPPSDDTFCYYVEYFGTNHRTTAQGLKMSETGGDQEFFVPLDNATVEGIWCINNAAFTGGTLTCTVYRDNAEPFATYNTASAFAAVFTNIAGQGGNAYDQVNDRVGGTFTVTENAQGIGVQCAGSGVSPTSVDTICNVKLCSNR